MERWWCQLLVLNYFYKLKFPLNLIIKQIKGFADRRVKSVCFLVHMLRMLFKTLPELVMAITEMYPLILHRAWFLHHIFKILSILSALVMRKSHSNFKIRFFKAWGFVILFPHFFGMGEKTTLKKTNQKTNPPNPLKSPTLTLCCGFSGGKRRC